jgi:hypothetical protein
VLRKTTFVFVLLTLILGMSSSAFAQKATVLRVVVVKTDNVAAYVEALGKGTEIMKKLGVAGQTRVWRATFAGPNAGSVVVAIEYPNMAAFADADTKTHADKDYLAWLQSLDKIRTIVSDSLYKEL